MRADKIRLFDQDGRFKRFVSPEEALQLVADDEADSTNNRMIVLASPNKVSGGWPPLQKSALEKHRRFVVGGMTRTENKPSTRIATFKR